MEKEMQDAVFWLPSEFLDDDFFAQEEKSRILLTESDEEEDCMAGLTKQMTRSILLNSENEHSALKTENPKVMAGSPQSTLYGHDSSNGPSQVNSPPSSPLEQSKEDPWDLLYEAADQVMRMRMNDHIQNQYSQAFRGHGILGSATKASQPISNPIRNPYAGLYPNHNSVLTQRQIQAAQFFHLRQQQLLKQQQQCLASAVWGKQNRAQVGSGYHNGAPLGLSQSAWPSLHKTNPNPLPGSNMRAVFLSGAGVKRESAGTGVFLPRRAGTPSEPPRKKPNCSTVLLPAKVVQALNLNLDEFGAQPRMNGGFMLDHEELINRTSMMAAAYQKQRFVDVQSQPSVQPLGGHDLNLPQEWTY
ncbi:hypothetical protein LUZ60_010857 [Juncus effusus]|nr:hypothetical protein LUZ60_010857 [Juncus effusus]